MLLKRIMSAFQQKFTFLYLERLRDFPLFRPEDVHHKMDKQVLEFKEHLKQADAVIISTPEYSHNIPAVLKNALEWITASGELKNKSVLPITFTPHEPRGKWAMESLLFTLKTLEARIPTNLSLYKTDVRIEDNQIELDEDLRHLINEALQLL